MKLIYYLFASCSMILLFTCNSDSGSNVEKQNSNSSQSSGQVKQSESDKLIDEILKASSYMFTGSSQIGNVPGESVIKIIGDTRKVVVSYSADFGNQSQTATETGILENITLTNNDTGMYLLNADWNNVDASSGSGRFLLFISDINKKQISCKIIGNGWTYWGFAYLEEASFNKLHKLLFRSNEAKLE